MSFSIVKYNDNRMLRYSDENSVYIGTILAPERYFTQSGYILYISDNLDNFQFDIKTLCASFANVEIQLTLVKEKNIDDRITKLQKQVTSSKLVIKQLTDRLNKLETLFIKGCDIGFVSDNFIASGKKAYLCDSSDEESC